MTVSLIHVKMVEYVMTALGSINAHVLWNLLDSTVNRVRKPDTTVRQVGSINRFTMQENSTNTNVFHVGIMTIMERQQNTMCEDGVSSTTVFLSVFFTALFFSCTTLLFLNIMEKSSSTPRQFISTST